VRADRCRILGQEIRACRRCGPLGGVEVGEAAAQELLPNKEIVD
jgi:hypothetical protein